MKRTNKTRKLTASDIENPSGTTKQCRKQYFSHIFNRLSIADWTLFRTQATPFSIQFSNNIKSINFNALTSIFSHHHITTLIYYKTQQQTKEHTYTKYLHIQNQNEKIKIHLTKIIRPIVSFASFQHFGCLPLIQSSYSRSSR